MSNIKYEFSIFCTYFGLIGPKILVCPIALTKNEISRIFHEIKEKRSSRKRKSHLEFMWATKKKDVENEIRSLCYGIKALWPYGLYPIAGVISRFNA